MIENNVPKVKRHRAAAVPQAAAEKQFCLSQERHGETSIHFLLVSFPSRAFSIRRVGCPCCAHCRHKMRASVDLRILQHFRYLAVEPCRWLACSCLGRLKARRSLAALRFGRSVVRWHHHASRTHQARFACQLHSSMTSFSAA